MVWGILGALDEEVALIREKMDVKQSVDLFGTTFYKGFIDDKEVVLVCSGIGKVNAAICANTVLREFGADLIINIGIAGAMKTGLKVLDVVLSREVGFYDQDRVLLKYYPKKEFFEGDSHLLALCERACSLIPEVRGKHHTGTIMSGDQFVNTSETKQKILDSFTPTCVEMEGAAVGQAAYMNGKPFLIIRTMSDTADDSADNAYDNFIHLAAEFSAKIILKMLEIA